MILLYHSKTRTPAGIVLWVLSCVEELKVVLSVIRMPWDLSDASVTVEDDELIKIFFSKDN